MLGLKRALGQELGGLGFGCYAGVPHMRNKRREGASAFIRLLLFAEVDCSQDEGKYDPIIDFLEAPNVKNVGKPRRIILKQMFALRIQSVVGSFQSFGGGCHSKPPCFMGTPSKSRTQNMS